MATSLANKQKLWYALQGDVVPRYERDSEGNIIYDEIDGERYPRQTGEYDTLYYPPVEFIGNISFELGWGFAHVYGITLGDADAILLMNLHELPIDETSLIWFQNEPTFSDSYELLPSDSLIPADELMPSGQLVDSASANFRVSRVLPSKRFVRYALKGLDR